RAQHVEPPGGESDSGRSQECAAISGLVRRHVGFSVNTGDVIRYARRTSDRVSRRQGIPLHWTMVSAVVAVCSAWADVEAHSRGIGAVPTPKYHGACHRHWRIVPTWYPVQPTSTKHDVRTS